MTSIKKIASLKDLPVFKNFAAPSDLPELRKFNLFYGFNGSGKTTLSRIFGSLQDGALNKRLPESTRFTIELDDGTEITETRNLDALADRILVFNEDFVAQCLRWDEGTADPVFYIGKDQAELAAQLQSAEAKHNNLIDERAKAQTDLDRAQRDAAESNKKHASLIAEALNLGRRYNATYLTNDYMSGQYGAEHVLSDNDRAMLKSTISQESPRPRLQMPEYKPVQLGSVAENIRVLLGTTIGEVTVADLRDHPTMLNWVSAGLEYHQSKQLGNCLFCGNELRDERLEALKQIIDGRFGELSQDIANNLQQLRFAKLSAEEFASALPSRFEITNEQQSAYTSLADNLKVELQKGRQYLTIIEGQLAEKQKSPNVAIPDSKLPDQKACDVWQDQLADQMRELKVIIESHNKTHDQFKQSQDAAKIKLRNHFLAEGQDDYTSKASALNAAKSNHEGAIASVLQSVAEVEHLKRQVRQHGPAAEQINRLLSCYLGHSELTIALSEGPEPGYKILKRGVPVQGILCQGEKTALSLCYFLSLLEAENRKAKDLVIVIDDPVSSLDTKALNYAFSLIKLSLSSAKQFIIMTHNLPLMNEVKKWLKNKAKADPPKLPTAAMFFIDLKVDSNTGLSDSTLTELPKLLRDYDSEYHYIFGLALHFSQTDDAHDEYFYLMPNVLRRVLDIFLGFKYPGAEGLTGKVEALADDDELELDAARIHALNRLAQLESHSDSLDDLVSFSSMTIEETRAAANALMKMMEEVDGRHFKRLKKQCS
jgi:wobble nucleotide-excising tRNase